MKILLDTNIFIHYILGNNKILGKKLINELADNLPDNYISIVSLWEIATKIRIGKLNLKGDFIKTVTDKDFNLLKVEVEHIEYYQSLPLHHRDPFDRMLIAQAISENMRIATTDNDFIKYSVKLLKN